MKKRTLALLLATLLLLTMAFAGCSGGGESSTSEASTSGETSGDASTSETSGETSETPAFLSENGELPIITDEAAFEEANGGKLTAAIVGDASRTVDINEMAMVQRWYEDTGVQFEWTVLNSDASAATEQISLMLTAGDDLPDVFWNFIGGQSSDFVVRYADQDVFLPTQDLIAEYCPTVQKVLDENAEYQLEVTYPDGNMYGFPYIEEMKGLVLTSGPLLINQDWLDQVHMEMPTTPSSKIPLGCRSHIVFAPNLFPVYSLHPVGAIQNSRSLLNR